MTLLIGFVTVLVRGVGLIAFAGAFGGAVFAFQALRPFSRSAPTSALQRSLGLVVLSAIVLALTQLTTLTLQAGALATETHGWPIWGLLDTDFARVGLARGGLALSLAAAAHWLRRHPDSPARWVLLGMLTLSLAATSGWLSHALGRLDGRVAVATLTALHQVGAAVWVGGLMHLCAFWLLWRRAPDAQLAGTVLAHFSPLALAAVVGTVASGVALTLFYVGSVAALVGTSYGAMVLTKLLVLAAALILGALNLLAVRRARRAGETPARVFWLVEAEIGLGLTILLAAASLTSLPPAIDVVADRATLAEVGGRFLPRIPRLTSPPVQDVLSTAAPITDTAAERKLEEKEWSEYNHHVAGAFVLAMGLLAILDGTGRAGWARHWPLGFLGLAAFMFVRNDPRAWPLGPAGFWESLALPDVLQHRTAVLLVVLLAGFEWAVRTRRFAAPRIAYVFPLLCAVGGALLLTHSHAMFSLKTEFLTEISHSPLGILGVFMGWSRWLELRLPARERQIPARIWPICLTLVGAILLTYREA